ncbi:alpha/beta hydrolase [Sphaerimonospora sp. CA-214678]|uniref:alpha/beta hydrolase n=1 Tax=Sphaerimonospora sp. CA-214678 TaxID=3240029 RepID=UPI003D9108F2
MGGRLPPHHTLIRRGRRQRATLRVSASTFAWAGGTVRKISSWRAGATALNSLAVPVAAHIRGSRLVTIDAQTHAPFLYHGNGCLNDAVNGFLAGGTLPPADTACPASGG